jgi:hypothetical protein
MRRPGVYETNETSRAALPFFRSKRLLSLYRLLHSHMRGKTNLGGEGETEVEVDQGVEAVLVDSIIPYVKARRLKLVRSQDD